MVQRRQPAWILGLLCALSIGCGTNNVLEPIDDDLLVLEYANAQVKVRYADSYGFPIQNAVCSFRIKGTTGGAMFVKRTATTDTDGICTADLKTASAATFEIVVSTPGAANQVHIVVVVTADAGGAIEATIQNTASAQVTEANVLLVDDLDCAEFDENHLPAPTTNAMNPTNLVPIVADESTYVKIVGLRADTAYTLLVTGMNEEQIVATACHSDLVLTEAQIERRQPLAVTVQLQDIRPESVDAFRLAITTQFTGDLGLMTVANLLAQMSDGEGDPARYVLSQFVTSTNETLNTIVETYSADVATALESTALKNYRNELVATIASLHGVKNIQLHTVIETDPEDPNVDTFSPMAIPVRHRFTHFTAEFDNEVLTVAITNEDQRTFTNTAASKFEETATLTVENKQHISIASHTLSIPLTDTIVGLVLLDNFQAYRLDEIIRSMVGCGRIGNLFEDRADADGDYGWDESVDGKLDDAVTELCNDTVTELTDKLYDQILADMKSYSTDQAIVFEGTANAQWAATGAAITALVNGEWANNVGTFEAVAK